MVKKVLQNKKKGFTLVEMMIVMGIFVIFSVIILADYKKFGEKQQFISFAYDMGLIIRQVQMSGIAVREAGVGTQSFSDGFGIHFSPYENYRTYTIFVDREDEAGGRNRVFGPEDLDRNGNPVEVKNTCIMDTKIRNRCSTITSDYVIKQVCALKTGLTTCVTDTVEGTLDIVFNRPDPDAHITLTTDELPDDTYTSAKIYITSEKDASLSRIITIDTTGQISIQ